jgi:hypothetical protein
MSGTVAEEHSPGGEKSKSPSMRGGCSGAGASRRPSVMETTAAFRSASPEVACSSVGVPSDVLQVAQLTAGERIRQEWSLRRASSARSSQSTGNSRGASNSHADPTPADTPMQRREAMRQAKHEALVQKLSARSSCQQTPRASPYPGSALSLWSRTKEQRFSYQYGNFEGGYPQFVPKPSLMFRAPALGSYGKSTSFITTV